MSVIINMAAFFSYQVLWPSGFARPFDWLSAAIALLAMPLLFGLGQSVVRVLLACACIGLLAQVLPWMSAHPAPVSRLRGPRAVDYPSPMFRALRTLPLAVRIALLALLVLGAVLRTGLQLVGEVHAAEHAVHAAAVDHDHDHDHGHHGDAPLPAPPTQTGHGEGSHALMHQAGAGVFADVPFVMALVAPVLRASAPVWHKPVAIAAALPATPFRPPIA